MPSPSVVTPKASDANHESCPMPFHLARSFAVLNRSIHRLHIQYIYIHTNDCSSWNDIKLKILALCSYESTIPQNPSLRSDIPKNRACQDAMKSRDHWSSIWHQWRSYKWPGRNKPRGLTECDCIASQKIFPSLPGTCLLLQTPLRTMTMEVEADLEKCDLLFLSFDPLKDNWHHHGKLYHLRI